MLSLAYLYIYNMEILQTIWEFVKVWYWVPIFILYIGVLTTILIENRHPAKTIAWILVIVFLPIIGLMLYYFFGQKYQKVRKLRRTDATQAERFRKEVEQLEPMILESLGTLKENIGNLARVYAYLKNEKLSLPSLRNHVELLINGEQKFVPFLEDLRGAKDFIHLEYYIYDLDSIGTEVLDILKEKAAQGVEVKFMADAFGAPRLVRHMRKLQDSNIEFQTFLPVTFTSLANSNYRNHRKIAVIDGKVAYVGGINISDKYINPNPYDLYWRDTAVRIMGESVSMLEVSFWISWNKTEGKPFEVEKYLRRTDSEYGDAAVSFATSGPGSRAPNTMEALLVGLAEAEEKIQLCTPYYVPSDQLETALMIAAASGIEVELMIPAKGDSWIVQHASRSFLKPLLERGVKVYLYTKGFLHAKTVNIDGKIAYIGTVNLDTRSFYINYEIAAVIADQKLCMDLGNQFERDKQYCELITLQTWEQRSRWHRGVDSVCRLMAPLL